MALSTIAQSLNAALSAVCPIVGVSIGNRNDKATWSYTVAEGTTAQQMADAASVFAAFDAGQAAEDTRQLLVLRAAAKATLASGKDERAKKDRNIIAMLLDEINLLRQQIVGVQTATWNPVNIANGNGLTSPAVTVSGAAFGDFVEVAAPYDLQGLTATAYVSAANTVQVRLENQTGGGVNLDSGSWKVVVKRLTAMPDRTMTQAKTKYEAMVDSGKLDDGVVD